MNDACERCVKAGDLACISLATPSGDVRTVLALHKNGTVTLSDPSVETLERILALVTQTWMNVTVALVMLLTHGGRLSREEFAEGVEAGFLKLHYYATMEGAVRERLRADGHSPMDLAVPGATQLPGRA